MAKKPHIIQCETCGSDRETKYRNTKYCHVCRIYHNLDFVGDKEQECYVCDRKFAPVTRNHTTCHQCDLRRRSYSVDGKCGICGKEKVLWQEDIHVCMECATDPKKRRDLRKRLHFKVMWLRDNPKRIERQPESELDEPPAI